MSLAYYNEHDSYAAEWLRNLIAAGHIAPGVVDSRDIRDIVPDELKGFTQCHFFAGIGVWSHALRSAGIPDEQPLWTGSCPCQPFSAAGGRKGIADERHLWPHWFWLIEQCRPPIVLGEQVASKDGLGWYDLVSSDLEGSGYAVGAVDLCAAGVGVEWQDSQAGEWLQRAIHDCTDPRIAMQLGDFADWAGAGNIGDGGKHIRQRLYFVGLADSDGKDRWTGLRDDQPPAHRFAATASGSGDGRMEHDPCDGRVERRAEPSGRGATGGCGVERLGDADSPRGASRLSEPTERQGGDAKEPDDRSDRRTRSDEGRPDISGLVDPDRSGTRAQSGGNCQTGEKEARGTRPDDGSALPQRTGDISGMAAIGVGHPRETGSLQSGGQYGQQPQDGRSGEELSGSDASNRRRDAVDWLFCRDDKWRSVESGTFPLAHGVTARVGKLRAFGNALDAKTATRFCEVVKEIVDV